MGKKKQVKPLLSPSNCSPNSKAISQASDGLCNDTALNALIGGDEPHLTSEELRQFPGFEHYTDEQAQTIVVSLMQLGEILYNLVISDNLYNVDNQSEKSFNVSFQNEETDLKNAA